MHLFELISLLIVLAALFSYANYRVFRLPTTIGVMLISMAASLALLGFSVFAGADIRDQVVSIVIRIDFNAILLHGMLAFLLFASALQLDLTDLRRERGAILLLATVGTLVSTFIVGGLFYLVLKILALGVPMIWCLLFGALISPTDPISVLGIMKNVGAPKTLETLMAGESLFNDGFGVVIFLVLLEILTGHTNPTARGVGILLLRESLGAVAIGLVAGQVIFWMLRGVDNYQVEVLLTLALAMGLYTLAEWLHVSAPIAVVVAGILIGNQGRSLAMSPKTVEHLDSFWELIDEILNAVLFLLIGMELLVIPFRKRFWIVGAAAIAITLAARWLSVGGMIRLMRRFRGFDRGTVTVLTWGGLRGGISVALALSLPQDDKHRAAIVAATYVVVVFSVFAQGLTIGPLIKRATNVGGEQATAH